MTTPFQPPLLTDGTIDQLRAEPKRLADWRGKLNDTSVRGGHARSEVEIPRADGTRFLVRARQSLTRPDEQYTVILQYIDRDGNSYRLLRTNGPHPSTHRNKVENEVVPVGPHVHYATQRYQEHGYAEDGYAVATTAYNNLTEAKEAFAQLVNLADPDSDQRLFP